MLRSFYTNFLILLLIIGAKSISSQTQQQVDLTSEIKRIRKELLNVQEERDRTKEEIQKDEKDFKVYRKKIRERMRKIRIETDSIKQVSLTFKSKNDSLSAVVEKEKAKKRQYELMQDRYRQSLIKATNKVLNISKNSPPEASMKHFSALKLLLNELETKSVDNIEGTNRLFQIIKGIHESSSSIQIVQGTSPVPQIRGTTYRIRIGFFFEAVVNQKGNQAAIWTGYDENNTAQWDIITDPLIAGQILKAVNVREGKALPELVNIPLDKVTVVKGE